MIRALTTQVSGFLSKETLRGLILYTPRPPPLRIPFWGWEAYYKRGVAYKIPATWGLEIYTPTPPSPGICLLARNGGRGGGRGSTISPWRLAVESCEFWQSLLCNSQEASEAASFSLTCPDLALQGPFQPKTGSQLFGCKENSLKPFCKFRMSLGGVMKSHF